MAERVRLSDGTDLDMLDPESIRTYVRKTLATNVEPSPQSLQRLKMLLEVADSLPQQKAEVAPIRLVDAQAAAAELRRRMGNGEK